MKLEHFLIVLEKIRTDIFCPKCKAGFNERTTEVVRLSGDEIELQMGCGACRSQVCIRAAILPSFEGVVPEGGVLTKLNPFVIQGISQQLQNVEGNIEKLFSE